MNTLEAVPTVKLWKESREGALRIGDSRVSLDSVVFHFQLGATAEQIFHKFPDLTLADIYGALSYYLTHRDEMNSYLTKQRAIAEKQASRIDSTLTNRMQSFDSGSSQGMTNE